MKTSSNPDQAWLALQEHVHLTSVERRLLYLLWRSSGATVKHDALIRGAWDDSYLGDPEMLVASTHMLRVAVHRVRAKIRPEGLAINTVTGVGYCLPRATAEDQRSAVA